MAHDSMHQVVREEPTVGKNVRNKNKGESDHGNKKAYAGNLPYCNKCKLHHTGSCTVKCDSCKRFGHMTKNCRTSAPATIKRAPITNQKLAVTCFGCGAQGHFKSKCPRLKNQNHDNQKEKEGKTRKNSKVFKDFTNA
nr:hypothetical protein [Tanacetum cinerariifolium]